MSMTLFRLRVMTVTTSNSLRWSNLPSETNMGSATEAKLHTAISSADVYSKI